MKPGDLIKLKTFSPAQVTSGIMPASEKRLGYLVETVPCLFIANLGRGSEARVLVLQGNLLGWSYLDRFLEWR
jgi:hypothetical protein